MAENKKRITYLDMAKGIGILLMVTVHTIGALMGTDNKPYYPYILSFNCSFTMALFLVVSGFLLVITKEEEKPLATSMKRKVQTLLIPYLVFSAVFIAISFFLQPGAFDETYYLHVFLSTLTGAGMSVLWFMPSLFIAEFLFLFGVKKNKIVCSCIYVVAGVAMVLLADVTRLPMWNENIGMYILGRLLTTLMRGLLSTMLLTVGYWGGKLITGRKKKEGAKSDFCIWELLAGIADLAIVAAFCTWNGSIDMNTMYFGVNPWLYFAFAILGSFGVVLLCKSIPNIMPLTWIGKNSLIIMLTHQDFLILLHARTFAWWLNKYTVHAKDLTLYLVLFLYMAVSEIITVHIFNTSFPFLLGKRKKKEIPVQTGISEAGK